MLGLMGCWFAPAFTLTVVAALVAFESAAGGLAGQAGGYAFDAIRDHKLTPLVCGGRSARSAVNAMRRHPGFPGDLVWQHRRRLIAQLRHADRHENGRC